MLAVSGGPARRPVVYIALAFLVTVLILAGRRSGVHSLLPGLSKSYSNLEPANATLGFGKLYVVSGNGSPRRAHLEQAAAITGLELTIPKQKDWTDADVAKFRTDEGESGVGYGSVKAWLAHHLVLRTFLASDAETAMIFEDDIDWDIHLRTLQVPLAQRAAQGLPAFAANLSSRYPWGNPTDWDIIYLGHCGDYWGDVEEGTGVGYVHPADLEKVPHAAYYDPSMPRSSDLHPFTASLLTALGIPERNRLLHLSRWPLCTFGYAVTRYTAQRILTEIAPAKEYPQRNIKAYDVAIMAACRESYQLRCYSMTPELFHHMSGESIIAELEASEREIFLPPVDQAGKEQTKYRGETSNIECGFWSGEFYYDEDPSRLPYLQEEVGRKNRCLKKGRERRAWLPNWK